MLRVTYDPNRGSVMPDNQWQEWLEYIESHWGQCRDAHYVVGNGLPVHLVLTSIALGKMSHSDVEFIYNGSSLQPNKYGSLEGRWPDGFCDLEINLAETRLKAMVERSKSK